MPQRNPKTPKPQNPVDQSRKSIVNFKIINNRSVNENAETHDTVNHEGTKISIVWLDETILNCRFYRSFESHIRQSEGRIRF